MKRQQLERLADEAGYTCLQYGWNAQSDFYGWHAKGANGVYKFIAKNGSWVRDYFNEKIIEDQEMLVK